VGLGRLAAALLVCMRRSGPVYISAAVAGLGWQVGCSDEAAVWCRCVLDPHPVWIGEMGIGGDAPASGFDCDAG